MTIEEPKAPRIQDDALIIETQTTTEVYDAKYLVSALLVFVAKGDGEITSEETAEMLRLVSDHFDLQSSQSLELLTKAMADIAENPDFENLLKELAVLLSEIEKEDVCLMMLRVVAADGRREVDELEKFQRAAMIIGISAETLHRAYDRYFAETMA
ncbi:MAG: TerB family tellurite resistance protein [Woeseiaceae bacterium]